MENHQKTFPLLPYYSKQPIPLLKKLWYGGLLFFSVTTAAAVQPLDTITFMPHWVPQAQFAGYFMAFEKNFYKDCGLYVKILPGGPGIIPGDSLQNKSADIVSMWFADGIKKKAEGTPLLLIAQIEQKSALMLIAKRSKNINKPSDMNHKKVSLWKGQFRLQPKIFFEINNITPDTIIPQSYSINLFLRDGVDVASAMRYNEFHTILNAGIDSSELTTFVFDNPDDGLNFPEACLFMLDSSINHSIACKFVSASLKGWTYAFNNEDETLETVLRYMKERHLPASKVHQRWMLQHMKEIITNGNNSATYTPLSPEVFTMVAQTLKNSGEITAIPEFDSFYKGCDIQ